MVNKNTNDPDTLKKKNNKKNSSKNNQTENVSKKRDNRRKESSLVKKIVFSIIFVGILLIFVVGFVGYNYVTDALQPLEPTNQEVTEIEVPNGTSTKGIGEILEQESIIKDATIFNYYLKSKNVSEFQAGFYEFSSSMELDNIISVLENGGTTTPVSDEYKILVKEGATLEEIAEEFASKSSYSKQDFIDKSNEKVFIEELSKKFPTLLTDSMKDEKVKYKLEGYLFPATYDYLSEYTIEEIITTMVSKTNEVMKSYRQKIEESDLDIHSVLTLASLVEKEGVNLEDRKKIASVFLNRLEEEMPLQSDISILYSLDEHLEYVTIENTEVDSPYNLYKNKGLGPGPFDNPSEESIKATLEPEDTNYLYFLADLTTGDVYFSKTFEEHLELQEKYVDNPTKE